MNGVNYSKKSIISFFAIVIVLSAIVEGWMIVSERMKKSPFP